MKIVVIGNGMVGQRLLEQLLAKVLSTPIEITVLCEEPRVAYDDARWPVFVFH